MVDSISEIGRRGHEVRGESESKKKHNGRRGERQGKGQQARDNVRKVTAYCIMSEVVGRVAPQKASLQLALMEPAGCCPSIRDRFDPAHN